MGALFELLAQVLTALAAVVLAQIADGSTAARSEPPSVQRTVLQATPRPAPRAALENGDCPEKARLQAA